MYQPKGDPFFEQLKAEIQEGIEDVRAGRLVELDDVAAELDALIAAIEQERRPELGPEA